VVWVLSGRRDRRDDGGVAAAPAGSAPVLGDHASSLEEWASRRRPYLDNLKVVLITAIIVMHAFLG
jgi:hypothetical protein